MKNYCEGKCRVFWNSKFGYVSKNSVTVITVYFTYVIWIVKKSTSDNTSWFYWWDVEKSQVNDMWKINKTWITVIISAYNVIDNPIL